MARHIVVELTARGVRCTARLLDEQAPRTCRAVWDALPQGDQVFHGKYARNEIYTLLPAFAPAEPGPENTTVTPIPGDLCYFEFDTDMLGTAAYGYDPSAGLDAPQTTGPEPAAPRPVIDLALFYGRNNLLINGDQGWIPGNVFGTVVEGLDEMAEACQSIWMDGARGETLRFSRLEA